MGSIPARMQSLAKPPGTDAMGNLGFGTVPCPPLSLLFAEQSLITSQIPWICLGYPCPQQFPFLLFIQAQAISQDISGPAWYNLSN